VSDFPSRFPAWVRWIPAVVLSIIIVAAVIVAMTQGPRFAAGPGPGASNEVDQLNFSVFTPEGLAYIDAERIPRVDLRRAPVLAEPLGLPSDGETVIGPHPQDLDYRLILLTNDGDGGARFTTAGFSIVTASGAVREFRIQPGRDSAVAPFREVALYVGESAERFGFAPLESGTLLDLVLAAQSAGEPQTVSTATGTSIGVPARLDVTCEGDGYCTALIVVTLE
jgi:hypothetical protein